jgi:hypothetical protein
MPRPSGRRPAALTNWVLPPVRVGRAARRARPALSPEESGGIGAQFDTINEHGSARFSRPNRQIAIGTRTNHGGRGRTPPRQLDQTRTRPQSRNPRRYGKSLPSNSAGSAGSRVKALKFKRIRQLEAAQANRTLGSTFGAVIAGDRDADTARVASSSRCVPRCRISPWCGTSLIRVQNGSAGGPPPLVRPCISRPARPGSWAPLHPPNSWPIQHRFGVQSQGGQARSYRSPTLRLRPRSLSSWP